MDYIRGFLPSNGNFHHPFNPLESSLRHRQENPVKSDDVSEIEEGEESAEKEKGVNIKVKEINNYFKMNPFIKSSEDPTVLELAKNPYDENAILAKPPESDDYIDLLLRYQRDIEYMVKNGAHPSDIVDSKNDGFVDKKKSAPGEGNSAKLTDAFILKARQLEPTVKGMSIQDIVTRGTTPGATEAQRKQADSELTALAVLAALSLRNAFKISDTQLPDLVIQIKDIYVGHARQSEIAQVIHEYYTLQQKMKNRWRSLKKFHKDLYYTLSLSKKRQNRRYKKGLALILGKMEERREHLVERYPKKSKNKRGKRGREKGMLDELIKLKEECQRKTKDNLTNAVKAQLPYDRILREMEKVFLKLKKSSDPRAQERLEYASLSFDFFKARVAGEGLAQTQYLTVNAQMETMREIKQGNANLGNRLEKVVKTYGASPWRSWVNDISSDAGFALAIVELGLAAAKVAAL